MSKLKDRLADVGRNMAAAAREVLADVATKARAELVRSLWAGDAAAAAEAYRQLGEHDSGPLIELAAHIVQAIPRLRALEEAGLGGREREEVLRNRLRAAQENPPADEQKADAWAQNCQRLEKEAYQEYLAATWSEAATLYIGRLGNIFPALVDHPAWEKSDGGPTDHPAFEATQKLMCLATSQQHPTRLVDGVLRSTIEPPAVAKRKVLVKVAMPVS